MPGHKASLDKRKKTENISNIFSDGNDMTLGINYKKKKVVKATNTRRLSNMLLNNKLVNKEIKGEIRKHFELNKNENSIKFYEMPLEKCLEGIV